MRVSVRKCDSMSYIFTFVSYIFFCIRFLWQLPFINFALWSTSSFNVKYFTTESQTNWHFLFHFILLQNVESSDWWRKLAIIMQCGDILIIINNPSINITTVAITTIQRQQEMMHHNYQRQSRQETPVKQQKIIRRRDKGWVESLNLIYIHFLKENYQIMQKRKKNFTVILFHLTCWMRKKSQVLLSIYESRKAENLPFFYTNYIFVSQKYF